MIDKTQEPGREGRFFQKLGDNSFWTRGVKKNLEKSGRFVIQNTRGISKSHFWMNSTCVRKRITKNPPFSPREINQTTLKTDSRCTVVYMVWYNMPRVARILTHNKSFLTDSFEFTPIALWVQWGTSIKFRFFIKKKEIIIIQRFLKWEKESCKGGVGIHQTERM